MAQAAATISKASGSILVERNGKTLELNQGDSVLATDTIKTQGASIELLFADGAVAMLSPQSTLKIQEFNYNSSEENSSFVLNLAQGAMRSISGKVVEHNPDAFKVMTPKATVGIRGTEFLTIVNSDKSEIHALISIDPDHNFVVTTYDGQQASLDRADQGVTLDAGEGTALTAREFTNDDIVELIEIIVGLISDNTDDFESSIDSITVTLDASAVAIAKELLGDLVEGLEEFGIELEIETAEDGTGEGNPPQYTPPSIPQEDEDIESTVEEGETKIEISLSLGYRENFLADQFPEDTTEEIFQTQAHAITITSPVDDVYISGDIDVNNANTTVIAADDSITTLSVNFSVITGDALNINYNSKLVAGNDTISIIGNVTGGSMISGDLSGSQALGSEVTWGNDTIHIQGNVTNSVIYGDSNNKSLAEGGDDTITVDGTFSEGSTILGGGGDDRIHVAKLAGGTIDGGTGTNTITGEILDSTTINVSKGTDTVNLTFGDATGPTLEATLTIEGASQGDSITINNTALTLGTDTFIDVGNQKLIVDFS